MFGEAFDDMDTYTGAPPRSEYLERLLGSETFIAVAAFDRGQIVGGVAAYVLPKFERDRKPLNSPNEVYHPLRSTTSRRENHPR